MNIIQLKEQIKSRFNSLSDNDTVVFDCGEFDITKREIISSFGLLVIMITMGIVISGAISDNIERAKKEYNQAIQIDLPELFEYGMETSVGNAFVYGQLRAVDVVTFDEVGGQWLWIEKELEEYTKHEKQVEHTDSKGNKYYTTEVYYSWDYVSSEIKHSEKITFLDHEFDYGQINVYGSEYIDTIYKGMDERYIYRGKAIEHMGTIFTKLHDGTIDKTVLEENQTIQEVLEAKNNNYGNVIFWIIWIILTIAAIYIFFYVDNTWLE